MIVIGNNLAIEEVATAVRRWKDLKGAFLIPKANLRVGGDQTHSPAWYSQKRAEKFDWLFIKRMFQQLVPTLIKQDL